MKKVTVKRNGMDLTIEAPEGKEMAIDQNALIQGILSIGEYGTSGIKLAAFKDWSEAIFDGEGHGYKYDEEVF